MQFFGITVNGRRKSGKRRVKDTATEDCRISSRTLSVAEVPKAWSTGLADCHLGLTSQLTVVYMDRGQIGVEQMNGPTFVADQSLRIETGNYHRYGVPAFFPECLPLPHR